MFRIPSIRKNARLIIWLGFLSITLLSIPALFSSLQGSTSDTLLSIPSLWFYSLLILPFFLFFVTRFILKHLEKSER